LRVEPKKSTGPFEWSEESIPSVQISIVAENLRRADNEDLKRRLGIYHSLRASSELLIDRPERALAQAELALLFVGSLPPGYLTNLGYVFLCTEELDRAAVILERAIVESSRVQDPRRILPALAWYDLAIVRAKQERYTDALELLSNCIAALEGVDIVHCQALLFPYVDSGCLHFKEIRVVANLVRMSKDSEATLRRFIESHRI